MADLLNVKTFFSNADAYAVFLARVEAAIVAKAVALREETPPDPVTAAWVARQTWASAVLSSPAQVEAHARAMLPALAIKANDAGFLSAQGEIDVTDNQIIATIDDSFVDLHAGYTPAAA